MRLFLDPDFFDPARADQLESVIAFARYCLPQVFFYGMFVLVGQVLERPRSLRPDDVGADRQQRGRRRRAGHLPAHLRPGRGQRRSRAGSTAGAEMLLGLGSTAGIVVQFLVLVPYLRAAGFRYRPRFDFRGSGLGHTLRLGLWTVLFVVVNQVAYTVVVRLASHGTVGRSDPTAPATRSTPTRSC